MRAWAAAVLLAAAASVRAEPAPPLTVTELRAPAVTVPLDPALASDRHGRTWLAWAQPAAAAQALFAAELTGHRAWDRANFVSSSVGGLDPILQVSPDGTLTAVWPNAPQAGDGFAWSRTRNDGRAWEGAAADWACAAVDGCALANGDFLAAWSEPGPSPDIKVRFLTGPYVAAPIFTVIHGAAAPTLQLRPLLDGGVLLIYLKRLAPGRVAIASARLHGRRWLKGRGIPLSDSPDLRAVRFDVDGGRVALVWIEGNRLLVSSSPDAGMRFSIPEILSPPAIGPMAKAGFDAADIAILHDCASVVVFRQAGSVWVERMSPEGNIGQAVMVLSFGAMGQPRIALAHDYAGADDGASLVVATRVAGSSGASVLRTFLVHVPEAQLLAAAADDCHCAPTPQQLLGYSVRGTVEQIDPAAGTITLQLDAVPGVMDPGEHTFTLPVGVRPALSPGDECLGRIEATSNGWRIFDLRRLGADR